MGQRPTSNHFEILARYRRELADCVDSGGRLRDFSWPASPTINVLSVRLALSESLRPPVKLFIVRKPSLFGDWASLGFGLPELSAPLLVQGQNNLYPSPVDTHIAGDLGDERTAFCLPDCNDDQYDGIMRCLCGNFLKETCSRRR